ncbi:MAG: lipid A-modifier LpxR family protein [Pseudorhodobacter sp.]
MCKALLAALAAVSVISSPVLAQSGAIDRGTLGFGRFFSNDAIGDGKDRWRTGSYTVSMVRGPGWSYALPSRFGEIVEYRLRSEVIAPANLAAPAATDRRYVGALSLGMHTHFALAGAEARVGFDLVATGRQTGVGQLQRRVHRLLDLKSPAPALAGQIGDALHPTLSAELGQSFRLSERLRIRPFVEAQAGVESYLRVGGDLTFGSFGEGALLLRDQVTGQRFTGIRGTDGAGTSFVLGGDVARVQDSAYLPSGGAAALEGTRSRLRAGLHWRGEKSEVFYGVTRLSREFFGQPAAQTVGSLRLRLRF